MTHLGVWSITRYLLMKFSYGVPQQASLVLFALLALPLGAQAPYLVKDINTTYSSATKSSSPTEFTSFKGKVFFVATTDDAGTELDRIDWAELMTSHPRSIESTPRGNCRLT